jgi:hypothetical protein
MSECFLDFGETDRHHVLLAFTRWGEEAPVHHRRPEASERA